MDVIGWVRRAKHRAFLAQRRLSFEVFRARGALYEVAGRRVGSRPFTFVPSRYPGTFLASRTITSVPSAVIPRRVFAFWTGENELTPNRARCLQAMRDGLGAEVVLITPENLPEWTVPEHPIHENYEHLSLTHRSDYLRAYMLHHHGGGYMDIKQPLGSWAAAFDRAEADADAWYTGRPEPRPTDIATVPGPLGRTVWLQWPRLVGMQSAIARAGSPFTAEWLAEVEARMTAKAAELASRPGGVREEVAGYPFAWADLGSRVLHPLQVKYLDHIRQDPRLDFSWENYR